MIKSDFREWTLDAIDDAFGMHQVRTLPLLEEWLAFPLEINDYQRMFLSELRDNYYFGGDDWNEVERKNKMISPLIVFSGISNEAFSYFLERDLSATIGEYELMGRVDGMIATGMRNPRKPYFCMAEYKRQTDPQGDPKGQALIAMLAAQALNNNQQPVFGCYIVGRDWHFMVLTGKTYAISNVYTASDEEIFDIFRILKGLRVQIERLIAG